MKIFLFYLKQHTKIIITFIVFIVIFITTFYLYDLPLLAVIYPTIICSFLGICFSIINFLKYKKKHNILLELQNRPAKLINNLPGIITLDDDNYQNIINNMIIECHTLESNMNNKYLNMQECYTIWVHQIKTPIASMGLSLQNEDTPLSRKLTRELLRIEHYVEMVLIYLRLNSDSTDYLIKEYNVDSIIKQTVKKFAPEFIEKKINLIYETIDFSVTTDEKWFSFVIEQILSNSLKYINSGFVKIYIKNNILHIEDSGIGIPSEDMPRIFEKGFTGYIGRSDKKASGIGLYLCKTICDRLNHKISISSTRNVGTIVQIDLSQYDFLH